MLRDIRETELYREATAFYENCWQPGTGQISDAAEIKVSADGRRAIFTASIQNALDQSPLSRIGLTDLETGATRVLSFGPNSDRSPKFSPDGRHIGFVSDRRKAGDFQLYLLDPVTGAARPTPAVQGWVEYFHWSPDGKRILLGVAGHGADVSGGQGAIASKPALKDMPSWMPAVETGEEAYRWRCAWVYELATDRVHAVAVSTSNLWEAVWCGTDALAAVVSPGPSEGLWFGARLQIVKLNGSGQNLYIPKDQLGWPAASPSGEYLAIVEAVCSDRWIVAGDLLLIEVSTRQIRRVPTLGIDITYTEWRSEQRLLLAGHRGFETVVALYDLASDAITEVWCSREISTGGRYIAVSGFEERGDCVLVGEGFTRAPEIAVIRAGQYSAVKSFDVGYASQAQVIGAVECLSWKAPDGLDIQGWLLRPKSEAPYPLIMNIHGGPVWMWHPMCLMRSRYAPFCLLLKHGYAVFLPNPRGSSSRGQDFARRVVGDIGGADTHDYLSGLDALVESGIADPARLGVTGVSYGGFMTSWLITQDPRFAAAVPVAPVTNQVTGHFISNAPEFVRLFLADHFTHPGGKYFERSPIMRAHKAKTPTLNICGALDRCTPPEEAVQFHNALLENRVTSVLVTYPEEGHGIHKLPAAIDFAARLVQWFETFLGNHQ